MPLLKTSPSERQTGLRVASSRPFQNWKQMAFLSGLYPRPVSFPDSFFLIRCVFLTLRPPPPQLLFKLSFPSAQLHRFLGSFFHPNYGLFSTTQSKCIVKQRFMSYPGSSSEILPVWRWRRRPPGPWGEGWGPTRRWGWAGRRGLPTE